MTVDPSSLIFVVIVAIWAAYLLGHWVRRRDQVATVRSVDRFSEAMRVLERRPAVRSVPLSRPNPRSYVVAPARPAAPQVSVKRAPVVAARPAAAPAARSLDAPLAGRAGRTPRRGNVVRAALLLALLVLAPVTWLLALLTQAVAWWMGALVTLALAGVVAELRQRARRARDLARRRQRIERRSQSQARRQTRRQVVGDVVAAHRERGVAAPRQPDAAESQPAEVTPDQPADDGWQPVPVPPPTYTLKPKAPARTRPVVPAQTRTAADEPAATAPAPAAPVAPPAPSVPAFDLDEILERRIASGS
ncbi:hypothetical protein ASD06_12650 [Angustibacter sp. Root456]|nr:hypothetical protein ASD06_12650 [Angustibacter sp. Root456]